MSKPIKLNWTVQEYLGCELQRIVDGKPGEPVPATEELDAQIKYCSAGLGRGYSILTIERDELGVSHAKSGGMVATLERGPDDRKCWVVTSWINLNALKHLTRISEPESPAT